MGCISNMSNLQLKHKSWRYKNQKSPNNVNIGLDDPVVGIPKVEYGGEEGRTVYRGEDPQFYSKLNNLSNPDYWK